MVPKLCFVAGMLAVCVAGCARHPEKWTAELNCYNAHGNQVCFEGTDRGTTIAYGLDEPGIYVRKNAVPGH